MAYNKALSSYKETNIKTANQGQLVIMLYDEAVKQLNLALELLELNNTTKKDPGKIEKISKAIMKAEDIMTELMVSLDFEQGGDISKNLFALYSWFNRELMEANIAHDIPRLTVVKDMVSDLRDAWHEAAAKITDKPAAREIVGLNIAG